MRTLRAFLIRLTGLLNGRASSEEDFSAELESHLIRSLLYGVPPVNLTVTVTVVISFLLVAALAAFVPARRAVSIDPMRTLRIE